MASDVAAEQQKLFNSLTAFANYFFWHLTPFTSTYRLILSYQRASTEEELQTVYCHLGAIGIGTYVAYNVFHTNIPCNIVVKGGREIIELAIENICRNCKLGYMHCRLTNLPAEATDFNKTLLVAVGASLTATGIATLYITLT